MTETMERQAAESLGTCATGSKTDSPCARPAVGMWGSSPLCSRHMKEAEVGEVADDYRLAVELLDNMIYQARGHRCQSLEEALQRIDAELGERLKDQEGLLDVATRLADEREA